MVNEFCLSCACILFFWVLSLPHFSNFYVLMVLCPSFCTLWPNIFSGAHTDYGLLTLVNQDDDITALQVRNKSGEWISAPPIPGTFVCNIGDMLKILSNGLYGSTLHRVINSSPKYRVCVAYFYETNFDAAIEPLDICVKRTGGTKKFERAVYGEHLVSKVQTNFVKEDELNS
ncbi:hypothetical protein RHGRI_023374 [Rhododendron griersonianum]|uniref:Fe2OG dioxygenase domain-containing protein n=1 Tax=Rhododendron griersonianum TaxID=479676 RepID=A0AAV6J346_9ERIC|nr:hypothetical protein RHGRI_023374 [Rhododendron griersonianum]